MSAASFAFAPTLTPGTFTDPPSPPADLSGEALLFPANADATTRRAAHAKKKPENHIPRPPNAFILFRSSFIKNQHVSSEVETNHSTLSKIIGLTWQNLPSEERQVWHAKAKAALEEHKRKFPQYAFRPLHTKGKGPTTEKRKVREVEPKDLKRCAKIAQLLIEGKKGTELDAAIQEFDRHHVPEVVTRFEAPITARHYRRSSSAPVPDTEHSNPPFLSPEPSTPSKRKANRSSSSQPEVPRTPAYECSTPEPSPPSEADTESDYYSSPSSPYVPTPSYSLASTNHSFDFSTFSFDNSATSAMAYQACDPLDQQGVFDAYSQDSQESCVSGPEMFNLTIDTSFMDNCNWTASSSPLSSIPGTPQMYSSVHTPCDPSSILDSYLSNNGGYDPSAEFLPRHHHHQHETQLYPSGVPAFCAPTGIDIGYGTQDFGGVPPKGDFASFYGRSALDPVDDAAFAPTYMASAPAFAI
ncbi:hypothetical protein OH76DRAFT_1346376 [Lentinus brumalis]|uniref:HMG box domain-containing protein n=1 Tax=Lentinus brumalis TaxID=2498619 RepID=A0A371DGN9_9APHY|nr:hypothetical protein OH76DRAFT_1346376 [Polyporus brumalis]